MCENSNHLLIEHMFGSQVDPLKIKLMKMSKGYQWEISCAGSDMKEILTKLRDADTALKSEYGSQERIRGPLMSSFSMDGQTFEAVYGGPEIELIGCWDGHNIYECDDCDLVKECPAQGLDNGGDT